MHLFCRLESLAMFVENYLTIESSYHQIGFGLFRKSCIVRSNGSKDFLCAIHCTFIPNNQSGLLQHFGNRRIPRKIAIGVSLIRMFDSNLIEK